MSLNRARASSGRNFFFSFAIGVGSVFGNYSAGYAGNGTV